MSSQGSKPVVVVPERSAGAEAARSVLAHLNVEAVGPDRAADADLAVVDLSTSAGAAALGQLRKAVPGQRLTVVALLGKAAGGPPMDGLSRVADFLSEDRVAEELPRRLALAQVRHLSETESQQTQKDLSLLLQLTADYAASLDVEELLHDVTKRLAHELGIERAALVVIDEAAGAGFIVAASDDAALKDLRIELSRYPEIREVVRTGKPVIVEDAPTHPLLEGVKTQVAGLGIHSIAALPLAISGKVLGVLLVRASARRGAFSKREIDFLTTVAHATAVALRNARLLESQRGQTEREKSARVAAEQRAAELKRYQSYYAHLSDGVAILDEKACVLALNPAGTQMLDVTADEAVGRHINALTNPSDDGVMRALLASVDKGESRREVDIEARTLAGRRLTLSVSGSTMKEGPAVAILSFRDVTAARQMAEELRQTKDFLVRLIDSSVDAIIAADMTGKVILFNKGAEAICGYTAAEALHALNVRQLYPDGRHKDVMARLRSQEFGGPGRLTVCREELVGKGGQRVPVNMTASIIYEGDREIATVGIFTDLRDRMQLERKLSDAETRLEESEKNAVIVALAGTAAHELNQPLTSVMGYAELLKRKLTETDFAYRPVDIIHREAERMAEIVRKIGKITRYETKSYIGSARILDLDKASSHDE